MSEDRVELSRADYDKLINGTLDVISLIGKVEAERDSLLRQVEGLRHDLEVTEKESEDAEKQAAYWRDVAREFMRSLAVAIGRDPVAIPEQDEWPELFEEVRKRLARVERAETDVRVLVQDINKATGVEYRDALDASLHLGNFIRNQKADMAVLKFQKERAREEGAKEEREAVLTHLRWYRSDVEMCETESAGDLFEDCVHDIENGDHIHKEE